MAAPAKILAPLGAVLAVTVVALTVTSISGGGADGPPPVLHLTSLGGLGIASSQAASGDLARPVPFGPAPDGAGGSYRLTGSLPAGVPADAPVWTLPSGAAATDVVAALASALHAGRAARDGSGWRAGTLAVAGVSGRPWHWDPGCTAEPGTTVSGTTVSGTAEPGTTQPGTAEPGTTKPGTAEPGTRGSAPGQAGLGAGPAGSGTAGKGQVDPGLPGPVQDQPLPVPPDGVSSCIAGSTGTGVIVSNGATAGGTGGSDGTSLPPTAQAPAPQSPAAQPAPQPPAPRPVTLPPDPPTRTLPADPPTRTLPPAVSPAAALAAAAPVLRAVGLDPARARVQGSEVVVDPDVDGRPTSGWATRVDVAPDGTLIGASGWLATPARGPAYPLVGAKAAYDALPPPPMMMRACLQSSACPEPAPQQVTGVRLGLALEQTGDKGREPTLVLVPAWLFDVAGSPEPLVSVAVAPHWLGQDEPPIEPSAKPGSRAPLGFDAVTRTAQGGLTVRYGDSSSCPHRNVTQAAKESTDTVVVVLESDVPDPGIACTADYRPVQLAVPLQAPLGGRQVIDGSTGKTVPVG